MQKTLLTVALTFAAAFGSTQAYACRVSAFQTPILHDQLPATLPTGSIAAEVEVITDVRNPAQRDHRMETRIIRMIQGDYSGAILMVTPAVWTSCDGWPYPGTRGILVGQVLSSSDAALDVDPIRAPSLAQLRRQAAEQSQTSGR